MDLTEAEDIVALWHVGSSRTEDRTCIPALAGGFFTTEPAGKPSAVPFNLEQVLSLYLL